VRLSFVLNDNGTVVKIAALSGDPVLVSSAIAVVRTWRFQVPPNLWGKQLEYDTEFVFLLSGVELEQPKVTVSYESFHRIEITSDLPKAVTAPLPSPVQVSPGDKAVFHGYPRMLPMQWEPVKGASGYEVEVDCYGCCITHGWCSAPGRPAEVSKTLNTNYTHEFVGDQPGRWRVWAVAPDGTPGAKSDWRAFTFGKTYEGDIFLPVTEGAENGRTCPPAFLSPLPPGTIPPKPVYNPEPEYTPHGAYGLISGTVSLGVAVGENGFVQEVCVLRSLRPGLDASAISVVKGWRFDPARRNGKSVPVTITVETGFRPRTPDK